MVDFVLVSLILIPLFLAILQLGFALYLRNTLAACAQDGARYAADENIVVQGDAAMTDAAIEQTANCVKESLPNSFANGITATVPDINDSAGTAVLVVEVRISAPFPLVGLFGLGPQVLHAQGDALQERP
ncbi:MAG TPA: TadE/TadG family type IV pilus assembly protein [Acidothermaceae bacterium]|nr:TadE/TadG family type IV pilus assembly protein [Acidothermaceae bacterium]